MSTLWQNKWCFTGPPMCHKTTRLNLTCVTASAEVPGLVLTFILRLNGPLIDQRISSQGGYGGRDWQDVQARGHDGLSPSASLPYQICVFYFFLLLFLYLKLFCFGHVDSLHVRVPQSCSILPHVCVIDQTWGQQLISRLMISFKCSKNLVLVESSDT